MIVWGVSRKGCVYFGDDKGAAVSVTTTVEAGPRISSRTFPPRFEAISNAGIFQDLLQRLLNRVLTFHSRRVEVVDTRTLQLNLHTCDRLILAQNYVEHSRINIEPADN